MTEKEMIAIKEELEKQFARLRQLFINLLDAGLELEQKNIQRDIENTFNYIQDVVPILPPEYKEIISDYKNYFDEIKSQDLKDESFFVYTRNRLILKINNKNVNYPINSLLEFKQGINKDKEQKWFIYAYPKMANGQEKRVPFAARTTAGINITIKCSYHLEDKYSFTVQRNNSGDALTLHSNLLEGQNSLQKNINDASKILKETVTAYQALMTLKEDLKTLETLAQQSENEDNDLNTFQNESEINQMHDIENLFSLEEDVFYSVGQNLQNNEEDISNADLLKDAKEAQIIAETNQRNENLKKEQEKKQRDYQFEQLLVKNALLKREQNEQQKKQKERRYLDEGLQIQESERKRREQAVAAHNEQNTQKIEIESQKIEKIKQQEAMQQVRQPEPVQQVQQPEPVQQVQQPEPVQQVQQPEPVQQVQQPEPVQQVQQPEPVQQVQQPEPVQQVQQPEPVQQVRQPEPVQQVQQPEPVQQVQQPEPVQQVQQPEPVQQPQPIQQNVQDESVLDVSDLFASAEQSVLSPIELQKAVLVKEYEAFIQQFTRITTDNLKTTENALSEIRAFTSDKDDFYINMGFLTQIDQDYTIKYLKNANELKAHILAWIPQLELAVQQLNDIEVQDSLEQQRKDQCRNLYQTEKSRLENIHNVIEDSISKLQTLEVAPVQEAYAKYKTNEIAQIVKRESNRTRIDTTAGTIIEQDNNGTYYKPAFNDGFVLNDKAKQNPALTKGMVTIIDTVYEEYLRLGISQNIEFNSNSPNALTMMIAAAKALKYPIDKIKVSLTKPDGIQIYSDQEVKQIFDKMGSQSLGPHRELYELFKEECHSRPGPHGLLANRYLLHDFKFQHKNGHKPHLFNTPVQGITTADNKTIREINEEAEAKKPGFRR